jgi:uncharacterized membrane protein
MARRRKDVNIKYGQADFKQSYLGMKSCVLAFLSFAIIVGTIWRAFVSDGISIGIAGGLGVLAIVFTVVGISSGIRGLKEKDRKKWSCKVGIISCVLILLVLLFIFVGGLGW